MTKDFVFEKIQNFFYFMVILVKMCYNNNVIRGIY